MQPIGFGGSAHGIAANGNKQGVKSLMRIYNKIEVVQHSTSEQLF